MNNDKKIIVILSISLVLIVGLIVYSNRSSIFGISTSKDEATSASIVESTKSASTMNEDIDFSKYKTTEVNLSGSYKIISGGVYHFTGSITNGSITVDTDENVKIILDNVSITNVGGPAVYIISSNNTYIELIGENILECTTTDELDGCIYSKDDLLIYGDGTLNIKSNYDGIASKDDLIIKSGTYIIETDDDGIRGKDSLTIHDGIFNINSNGDALKTTNEEEKGSLVIEAGIFDIISNEDGLDSISTINISGGTFNIKTSGSSAKGIKAESDILITDGTFNIYSEDDSIHSNSNISIEGGTYAISTNDDGIHSDGTLIIENATMNIEKSHEGLEGSYIIINSGDIKIYADDDGINVSGGNDSTTSGYGRDMFSVQDGYLKITGGTIYVNSKGDGLDSNGSIYITGGTTYVDGPTDNGNGALDYNGSCEITGGTLIAVGSSGMAETASSATQPTIRINLSNMYSGTLTFGSITYTPSKSYQSVVISSSEFTLGDTYTLNINGEDVTNVTISNNITNSGNFGIGGGMQGGMTNQRMRR